MTRIMSWNIQDLAINKLRPNLAIDPNNLRGNYIIDTIETIDPDILVVVEVETGMPHWLAGMGFNVSDSSGGPAVRAMLSQLRLNNPAAGWALVPPLVSGAGRKKEGVGVFFKSTTVNFRGPQQVDVETMYDGVVLGSAGDVKAPVNLPWAPPWDWVLPPVVPVGPPIGPAAAPKQQNQLSGKAYFDDPLLHNIPLFFPDIDSRSPFLTVFREVGGANRTIEVLGVHFPPTTTAARAAFRELRRIPGIFSALGANDVRVVCGDFNVNFLNPAHNTAWTPLTNHAIARPGGMTNFQMVPAPDPTMYKSVPFASLVGVGPDFDTISTGSDGHGGYIPGGHLQCLDAIFAAFGTDPAAPLPSGMVVNRVVATPYPPAAMIIPQAMMHTVAALLTLTQPATDGFFRWMDNYGKIRGSSDHMPLVIEF